MAEKGYSCCNIWMNCPNFSRYLLVHFATQDQNYYSDQDSAKNILNVAWNNFIHCCSQDVCFHRIVCYQDCSVAASVQSILLLSPYGSDCCLARLSRCCVVKVMRPHPAHSRCWSTPRVAHSLFTFARMSCGRLTRWPLCTSQPRETYGDLKATWRSPARSLALAGARHCLPLHSQSSDCCFRAVAGSHCPRFARCLATVHLLTAPTQPRRHPPSRGAALPTVASRGSATIQPLRIPSIPSAATTAKRQRRRHPVAEPSTILRQLCVGGASVSPLRAQTETDWRTDFYYSIQ